MLISNLIVIRRAVAEFGDSQVSVFILVVFMYLKIEIKKSNKNVFEFFLFSTVRSFLKETKKLLCLPNRKRFIYLGKFR